MRPQIPWYLKIPAKVVLSRLPVSYGIWSRMGLFKHGQMATEDYARKIFSIHMEEAERAGIPKDGTYLEMGTGDSVVMALLAAARGCRKIYLVDTGDYATRDMDFYKGFADKLRAEGGNLPAFADGITFEEMLGLCRAEYLKEGLTSLRSLPEDSIDFIWSHATMEHVRKGEFTDTVAEMYRILKPGGVASHNIDMKDHLGGALNNLRFDEGLWESEWMVRSGFYTNRLRYSEIKSAFEDNHFSFDKLEHGRWESIPTPREKMNKAFRDLPDDDLLIRGMSVVARKPGVQSAARASGN